MKFSLLPGAYKKRRGFLAVERCIALLQDAYSKAEIAQYERRKTLFDHLDQII